MRGYKLLAHDGSPPLQKGEPVWDCKTFPFELPKVALDTSEEECAGGWNFCRDIATAARIAGLWADGKPRHILTVETIGEWVERGDKLRAEGLRLVEVPSDRTIVAHLGRPFGKHAQRMGRSQLLWHRAFGRPNHDEAKVEAGLRAALDARGLDWTLVRYEAARDAWDAWTAWDAWAARDARAARDAWTARAARDAWTAWAARDAWDAWTAWDAWAALTVEYAALMGWTKHDPDLMTTGLRDAYFNGLGVALPTGPNELGWAMRSRGSSRSGWAVGCWRRSEGRRLHPARSLRVLR